MKSGRAKPIARNNLPTLSEQKSRMPTSARAECLRATALTLSETHNPTGIIMHDSNSNAPPLSLVGGPVPLVLPCVSLRFTANGSEVSVLLLSDRTVFVPGWLETPPSVAATERARQFEKDHRIVIHELLKCARQEIRPNVTRRIGSSITNKPTLSHAKEMVFRMNLDDSEVILHVSRQLFPCQIHLDNGEHCNSELLFEAYDLALEYMESHVDELERLGFDTSILRLSVEDWLSYRERMRLV